MRGGLAIDIRALHRVLRAAHALAREITRLDDDTYDAVGVELDDLDASYQLLIDRVQLVFDQVEGGAPDFLPRAAGEGGH